jgi:hypothetical protein
MVYQYFVTTEQRLVPYDPEQCDQLNESHTADMDLLRRKPELERQGCRAGSMISGKAVPRWRSPQPGLNSQAFTPVRTVSLKRLPRLNVSLPIRLVAGGRSRRACRTRE